MVGGVTSTVQLIVLESLAELPQASVVVHVLVCERRQPLLCRRPSTGVADTVPQLSVALALPRAALMSAADGLHVVGSGV